MAMLTIASSRTVSVVRAAFEEERAECAFCGAYTRPAGAMTQIFVRRALGDNAAAGACSVCGLMTYFRLV